IIDFGFLCLNIRFNDTNELPLVIGQVGDDYHIALCNKRAYDIVMFLTLMINTTGFFMCLDFYTEDFSEENRKYLTDIITLDDATIKSEYESTYKYSPG